MFKHEFQKVKSALDGQLYTLTSMAINVKDGDDTVSSVFNKEGRSLESFTMALAMEIGELYITKKLLQDKYLSKIEWLEKYINQHMKGTFVDPAIDLLEEGEEPWDAYQSIENMFTDGSGKINSAYIEFAPSILEMYHKCENLNSAMMSGFNKFFPSAAVAEVNSDGFAHVLSADEKEQLADKSIIAAFEREFKLTDFPEFITEVLDVCRNKGDLQPILNRI